MLEPTRINSNQLESTRTNSNQLEPTRIKMTTAKVTGIPNAHTLQGVPNRTAPINPRKALHAACIALFGYEAMFPVEAARRVYEELRAEGTIQENALEAIAHRYNVSVESTFCVKGTTAQEEAWRANSIARSSTNRV